MAEILTPCCPSCGSDPVMVFGAGTQAFCGNDDCPLLTWTPTKSLDDNLLGARVINWPPEDPPPAPLP